MKPIDAAVEKALHTAGSIKDVIHAAGIAMVDALTVEDIYIIGAEALRPHAVDPEKMRKEWQAELKQRLGLTDD